MRIKLSLKHLKKNFLIKMSNIRSILFYKKLKIIRNSLNKTYKKPKKKLEYGR